MLSSWFSKLSCTEAQAQSHSNLKVFFFSSHLASTMALQNESCWSFLLKTAPSLYLHCTMHFPGANKLNRMNRWSKLSNAKSGIKHTVSGNMPDMSFQVLLVSFTHVYCVPLCVPQIMIAEPGTKVYKHHQKPNMPQDLQVHHCPSPLKRKSGSPLFATRRRANTLGVPGGSINTGSTQRIWAEATTSSSRLS